MKVILRGDLQAYTATKNRLGDKATLPISLYAALMVIYFYFLFMLTQAEYL